MQFLDLRSTNVQSVPNEIRDDTAMVEVQCIGDSINMAASLPRIPNFKSDSFYSDSSGIIPRWNKIVVLAHWIDASNFGLRLPMSGQTPALDIEVYTDAPAGQSITVYTSAFALPPDSFIDGSTSRTIDNQRGLKFVCLQNLKWGILGA